MLLCKHRFQPHRSHHSLILKRLVRDGMKGNVFSCLVPYPLHSKKIMYEELAGVSKFSVKYTAKSNSYPFAAFLGSHYFAVMQPLASPDDPHKLHRISIVLPDLPSVNAFVRKRTNKFILCMFLFCLFNLL